MLCECDHEKESHTFAPGGESLCDLCPCEGFRKRLPTIKEMSGLIKDFTRGKSMKEYMEELSDE